MCRFGSERPPLRRCLAHLTGLRNRTRITVQTSYPIIVAKNTFPVNAKYNAFYTIFFPREAVHFICKSHRLYGKIGHIE